MIATSGSVAAPPARGGSEARRSANASRSMPTTSRFAASVAASVRSTESRKAITSSTRWTVLALVVDGCSEHVDSRARPRRAASRGSRGRGSRRRCRAARLSATPVISIVRTPIRVFASPSRTPFRGRSLAEKRSLSAVARPAGSRTSPPLTMPSASGAWATRTSFLPPLLTTWAAVSPPASIFRPTISAGIGVRFVCLGRLAVRLGRRPAWGAGRKA